MTRTIESLKKIPSKEDVFHKHIADTYFHQKTHRRKTKQSLEKTRIAFFVSLTGGAIIAVLALSLFIHKHYIDFLKHKIATSNIVKIFDNGRINRDVIRNFEFRGYAKGNSKFSEKMIFLNNPRKYNWADFAIDFRFPIDLSRRNLALALKGRTGGEKLSIILRDTDNRSYRLRDISLASNWKDELLPFDRVKEDIDLSKITHMRFEYGYIGESSKKMDSLIDVTIYIRNIKITKEA